MEKINRICKAVLKLTEEDFGEVEKIIEQQCTYNHSLKNGTVIWQRELAEHNTKVLEKLRELKDTIKQGETIKKPT